MYFRLFFFLSILILFVSCSSKRKNVELHELLDQDIPYWLKEHPVSNEYYYGIGIASKIGNISLIESEAKKKALNNIIGQINTQIESSALYYQSEDNSGVHEYLQNRIKATSSEYIEGYEYVDKWEDLSNLYVFYRLSKEKYKQIKEQRRKDAFKSAKEKYINGINLLNAVCYGFRFANSIFKPVYYN